MKYHYIPKYDETVFNRIANETDPILEERWKRRVCTDIVQHRTAILRELSDLRCKPRRTLKDARSRRRGKEAYNADRHGRQGKQKKINLHTPGR